MLDSTTRTTRPFTGAGYLESLRDRREVYVYGADPVRGRARLAPRPSRRSTSAAKMQRS